MEKENGITLVALIVSIIVLLILATVSISLVINNGIIDKAESAVNKYLEGEICEQIKIAYLECQTEKLSNSSVDEELFIRDSLKEKLKDESLSVKVKNGKVTVNTLVKGENKTYIFKVSSGEAYEYKDPFDYGTKTKETLVPGDDITLGTEKFRVFYNQDGVIKAMPWYNIELKTDNPKQSISAGTTSFSQTKYWIKGNDEVDMNDNSNYIQKYIVAYKAVLEKTGTENIIIRVAKYSELNVEEIIATIKNPSQTGTYWLGSGSSGKDIHLRIVSNDGSFSTTNYYSPAGVRPIIIIEY